MPQIQVAGWYSSSWAYRWPVAVDVSTAGATSDVTIVIPTDFDHFWSNVQADGDDIRVTAADGVTLITYDIAAGFNATTRSGTIELDNMSTLVGSSQGASIQLVWVYWGNAGAASAVSAFAPAAAISGYFCLEAPLPAYSVQCKVEPFGSTRPTQRVHLYSDAASTEHDLYFNLSPVSASRSRAYNGGFGYEAPRGVVVDVRNESTKAAVASAVLESSCRFVYTAQGELWARVRVDTSGTLSVGTDYIAILRYFSSVDATKTMAFAVHLDVHDLYTG
jgi:hypothetical protein